jgi:hypothetical protein
MGRWIEANPALPTALTEATEPRFLIRVPFVTGAATWFDLGPGAEVENLAFAPDGRTAFLVAAVISPHEGQSVSARALLEIDLETRILVDSFPLDRGAFARGFALDARRRRAYLLEDGGDGVGRAVAVDLYRGDRVAQAPTGVVPASVNRKGLVIDRHGETVYCLSGGDFARHDFQPVDVQPEETGPELYVFGSDSLDLRVRMPLSANFEAQAMDYDPDRDRLYVLESNATASRLLVVDAVFVESRASIDFPEPTTDVVVRGGYAFCPGANGVYIADLSLDALVSRSAIPFDLTGEVAVSRSLENALVLFQSSSLGGPPGIARVELTSGRLLQVLQ